MSQILLVDAFPYCHKFNYFPQSNVSLFLALYFLHLDMNKNKQLFIEFQNSMAHEIILLLNCYIVVFFLVYCAKKCISVLFVEHPGQGTYKY